MTEEEKIICKQFLNDADKTHSCNEYKLLMNLIDQETVSKEDYDHEYFLRRKMETQIDHLHKYISKLETQITEQEPKKGHWIDKFSLIASCSAECSACHERSSGYVYDTGYSLKYMYYDFCPNCGADMRGVEE